LSIELLKTLKLIPTRQATQVLQQESPRTIDKVKAVLERHPWYTNQRQARVQDIPVADHDMMLFMQTAS